MIDKKIVQLVNEDRLLQNKRMNKATLFLHHICCRRLCNGPRTRPEVEYWSNQGLAALVSAASGRWVGSLGKKLET